MNFEFNPEDEDFRLEVRQFMRDNLPPDISRRAAVMYPQPIADYRRWQKILNAKGWGAPHLPSQYGGSDWSQIRKHIFLDELYKADGIDSGWQGLYMVAPIIIAFGSEAQKERFLPPMLNGDEYWCQGFSEPSAGSDLANLRTRADLVGDEWVINGQKIWTSDAAESDWGFFLVRTDQNVKPQKGISFLLVKMDTPGITVRPIEAINGGRDLNEVFLDNVRVPKYHLVGEAGMGWTYAKYLLEKERTTSAFLYFNKRELERAKESARRERIDGIALIDTPAFARKLALVEADLNALEWSVLRILTGENSRQNADAVVSALKISGSEMQQRVTELQVDALGARALRDFGYGGGADMLLDPVAWPADVPGKSARFLFERASTIFGGTREVQKNIIAKLAFNL